MMDTIVIFGATGSVGVYTALFLKKKGYNIIAVGQRKSDNGFFAEYDIPYYSVNIANKNDFNILPVSGVDQVLHFAGAMPARMQGYDPYQYVNSIITGTLNVLEYIRKVNALKVIFTQSIADVLHLFGSTDPISPDSVRKFPLIGDHSIYSISKNAAVDLIEHYFNQYAIKRFILRLPTIYVYHPNPYYYVDGVRKWMGYRYLIDRAINGKELEIWGDPFSKKEIVYVKDFVQIVDKCVQSSLDGGIYNVGRGIGVTLEEQIQGIIDVFCPVGVRSKIRYCPEKKDSPQFILDVTKTIEELGYIPNYDYKSYLNDFKQEMQAERFCKLWGRKEDFYL